MYQLTLTSEERKAVDWIGGRYEHGHYLFKLLCDCKWIPNDVDWDSKEDITFKIPEYVSWHIKEIGERCNYAWDCFANELNVKLTNFCLSIV